MNSRLAPVPSTGRSVADPVSRVILAVDIEGSTQRVNPMKGELRRVMYALLDRALRATGIDRKHLEHPVDRGDGVLLLFRPHDDVPKTHLLGRLIPTLAALLAEHNATVTQPALRMRLRAVLHAGDVHDDGWGFYGEDLDLAFRLLDSPAVKQALRDAPDAPVVLVISDEIHSGIIRHGYVDIGPAVRSVSVSIAERRRRGWVHLPAPAPAGRALQAGRPKTSARAASLAIALPPAQPEGATA
jgi:hypothetical protein